VAVHRRTLVARRRLLHLSSIALGLAAATPILQACGGTPSPTAAPAAAKPTEAPKPAAGGAPPPTTAPAGAATKPAAAPAAAAAPAKVGLKSGPFKVVQFDDYHPDHNKHVKAELESYAKAQGWQIEISPIAAFMAGADIYQKALATVQAGDPPDLFIHTDLAPKQAVFLKIAEKVTDVMDDLIKKYGRAFPGAELANWFTPAQFIQGGATTKDWYGVPFYGRTGGYWVRKDLFSKAGIDIDKDLETYQQCAEACLKISNPGQKMWAWGVTTNRSGDGESLAWASIQQWGGTLTDKEAQIVTLNSPETIAGVKWMSEIYMDKKWENMIPPGVNAWTDPSNNEAFIAGTVAFTSNAGTMYAKAVFDKVPFASEIRVINQPKGVGPKATRLQGAGAARFNLFTGVRNRDGAKAVIEHFMTKEVQEPLYKTSTGYVFPVFKNQWENPLVRADENNKRFEAVAWAEPAMPGVSHPAEGTPWTDAVSRQNLATDMYGQVLKGKKVEDAVKETHDRAVKIFKEFGRKGE
jgi:multiple sugar transport system substrate-binding protein